MADFDAIRQGLKFTLQASLTHPIEIYTYVPGDIKPPCMAMGTPEVDYDKTFGRGLDELVFPLYLFVSANLADDAQRKVDSYISPAAGSVKAAVFADKTLNGSCATSIVTHFEPQPLEIAAAKYDGGVFYIRVWAPGT